MKLLNVRGVMIMALAASLTLAACSKDDDNTNPNLRTQEYTLTPVANSGITGKVTLEENADHSFNVWVNLDSSATGVTHQAAILHGSIASPGSIALMLDSIPGTGAAASSKTANVTQLWLADSSMMAVTYDSILAFDGSVNVYYSADRMDSILAQANIGSN